MRKTLFYSAAAMCGMALMLTACDKDNNDENESLPGGKGHILIEPTIKNDDGASGASYLLQVEDFGKEIKFDNAMQVGFSSTISIYGNDVYVFPSEMIRSNLELVRYVRSADGLSRAASMQITPGSAPYTLIKYDDSKAYIPQYGLGNIQIVNPMTLELKGEINLSQYAYSDQSADPARGIIRDGKLFIALDQVGPTWMPFEDHRQIDVLVIDVNTDVVEKMISETTSGLSFPTRPFLPGMMFINEAKDIYIACCGNFGYDPTYVKNGFVCIPAGSTDFDTDRTWDISETVIEGTNNWKPASIYNSYYMGNDKVIAFVACLELNGDNPYTAHNSIAVVIDLNSKTIKRIQGIPNTDPHSGSICEYDGKFYVTAYGVDASGVFSYDPATGTAEQVLQCNTDLSYLYIF